MSKKIIIPIILILVIAGIVIGVFYSLPPKGEASSPEDALLQYVDAVKNSDIDRLLELSNKQEREAFLEYTNASILEVVRRQFYDENGNELPIKIIDVKYLSGSGNIDFPEGRVAFVEFNIGESGHSLNFVKEKGYWKIVEDPGKYKF